MAMPITAPLPGEQLTLVLLVGLPLASTGMYTSA
jgi:hypothetical protein